MKNRKIFKITYNWHQYGNNENGIDENFCIAEVGKNDVKQIEEFIPSHGLEKHYCIIFFGNGTCLKVFNLDIITYGKHGSYIN